MLGFQTWGCRMVGADKTTELPLQPQQLTFWADIVVHLLTLKRSFPRLILNNLPNQKDCHVFNNRSPGQLLLHS